MERLTQKIFGDKVKLPLIPQVIDKATLAEFHDVRRWYEDCVIKLAQYEDAEAEGLLFKLPCKIGIKLWHIYDKDEAPKECYASEGNIFLISRRLGQTVFLTKESAEAALKGNNNNDTN